ncbi:MAG: methyltransferase domain-containing protein, partial [Deltaproteobacteria bacterium]|nr:methyltransferase domain-containing protein [Deltaproteobacteria bacterium]
MNNDPQAVKEQAYMCVEQGDFQGALGLLTSVSARREGDAELANDIGVVLHYLGRTAEALNKFREAHALSGEGRSPVAENLLGILDQLSKERELQLKQALTIWQNDSAAALRRAAAALSDEEWFQVLFDSVEGKLFDGHILPGFIEEDSQRMFVGSSGVPALIEGANFIRVLLRYARGQGIAFDNKTRAVDFGSGWGRYTRFMLKYIHPDNLYGLEVSSNMVEHCRKSFGMGNHLKVDTFPPCDLRDSLVDLIFGYSVFSHLSSECAGAWIDEFARILRPGGLVLMTTQGRTFIEYCRKIRESGDRSHEWFINLADSFVDVERSYSDYDAGEFLHAGHGQYGGTYGESLISRGYILKHWLEYFDLVDFVDDRAFLP